MTNLIGVLESTLFLWGLLLGGICLAAVGGLTSGRTGARPLLPIAGYLISVASMIAFTLGDEVAGGTWVALGLIAVLTLAAERVGASRLAIAAASVPGAVLLASAIPVDPSWFRVVVLVAIPVAGYLVDDFESRHRERGMGVLFFGLAVLGAFLAVPDTDMARAMVAVCLPIMFLAWPKVKVSLGTSGTYCVIAVFSLSTIAGGEGRPASVVGALACLGFLVLEPIAVRLRPGLDRLAESIPRTPEAVVVATIPQTILVWVASRVAGPLDSRLRAALIIVVLFGLSYVALVWLDRVRVPEGMR